MNYTLHLCFCYINICMNDYKQLQAIYEGQGGISRDTAPNDRYTATIDPKNSYNSMGFNSAQRNDQFALNFNNTRVTPVESEEEQIDGEISKLAIVRKIEDLQNVAAENGMDCCIHTLGTLIEFIKKG